MLLFLSSALTSAIDRLREAVRRRGLPFVLALVVEGVIAVALFFFLTAGPPVPKKKPIPTVFGIDVGKDETAEPTNKTEAKKGAAPKASSRPAEAPPEPVPTPPVVTEAPPSRPNFIRLTRRDYARGDIATLPSQGPPVGTGQPAETAGLGGAGDSPIIGRAPNGEPLYNAEWHVEPTDAQLGAYISPQRTLGRPGVGLIACRTVARYRVEDCQELGETPTGSGYAGSVRQAAFQFLVRPPRKGGKALVGSWVRIRIDYGGKRKP